MTSFRPFFRFLVLASLFLGLLLPLNASMACSAASSCSLLEASGTCDAMACMPAGMQCKAACQTIASTGELPDASPGLVPADFTVELAAAEGIEFPPATPPPRWPQFIG